MSLVRSILDDNDNANNPPTTTPASSTATTPTKNADEVALTGRSSRAAMVQALYDICNPTGGGASLDQSQVRVCFRRHLWTRTQPCNTQFAYRLTAVEAINVRRTASCLPPKRRLCLTSSPTQADRRFPFPSCPLRFSRIAARLFPNIRAASSTVRGRTLLQHRGVEAPRFSRGGRRRRWPRRRQQWRVLGKGSI